MVEIYKDSVGQFRFRIVAANGEITAVSESYTSKQSCVNGIRSTFLTLFNAANFFGEEIVFDVKDLCGSI